MDTGRKIGTYKNGKIKINIYMIFGASHLNIPPKYYFDIKDTQYVVHSREEVVQKINELLKK